MAETSGISWTHMTASPWFGCTEVSPGCTNCYARELTLQHKWAGWGDKSPRVRSKGFWKDVYKWNNKAQLALERPRIFTSLMDWLDPMVPIEWLAQFMKVVDECKNLDWLLLTKRPELFESRMEAAQDWHFDHGDKNVAGHLSDWRKHRIPFENVWFGVTTEDQNRAVERITELMRIPAKIRWLSMEPLLEYVDIHNGALRNAYSVPTATDSDGNGIEWTDPGGNYVGIDWAVVGGESGAKRRDCGVEALIKTIDEIQLAGVAVWVKQDCAIRPGQQGRLPTEIFNLKQLPV